MSTHVKSKSGGYATFPNRWFDAGYAAKSPGSITQVYMFLCRWADNATDESCQAIKMIATKTGLSEDVARKAVRILEEWGCLTRHVASGPNAKNVWTLEDLQQRAPDYPNKVTPKQITTPQLSGPPQSVPPQITTPYQPECYQPEEEQPKIAAPSAPQISAIPQDEASDASKAQVNARRFKYWEAMVEDFGWTGPQANSARGRALRELKTAFPNEQALQEIPLERFRVAARKYAATTDPKFYSAAHVIASMEARKEAPPTNLKPYWNEYMKMTMRDRSVFAENPNEKIRNDFMRTLTRILSKTPTLTPNDVMSALWQWDHSLNPIPGFDIWEQAVNTWLKSGRQDHTAERRKFHR